MCVSVCVEENTYLAHEIDVVFVCAHAEVQRVLTLARAWQGLKLQRGVQLILIFG